MAPTIPAVDEITHRAEAIYESGIRQKVEGEHDGQIVMIDIDSGDFEIDDYLLPAADRIKARHPAATLYPIRIGSDAIYSFRPRRARPKVSISPMDRVAAEHPESRFGVFGM